MGKPTGFIEFLRVSQPTRPVAERVGDYRHVYAPHAPAELTRQAARCMDCGIPFCHQGCPLGNLIPDWNDLVYRDQWRAALDRLHATNNFPEFTGMLCPAPCEGACVLGLNADPVSIKSVELAIVDRGFAEGWIVPEPPVRRTWKRVAIVGSGPAGLAAAAQLNRAGHTVTVFEKAVRIGGLLRYGIPEFKLEKRLLDRRLALLEEEGVVFRAGVNVGVDLPVTDLQHHYDAVLLAGGAEQPRDLPLPGRHATGIVQAMTYLTAQNERCESPDLAADPSLSAAGRHVVIIGGGDTGADCVGTAHRQGAASVTQLERMPMPPASRAADNPWPLWPHVFRTSTAHEEGGTRTYAIDTTAFLTDDAGHVRALRAQQLEPVPGGQPGAFAARPDSTHDIPADLVILALGFSGPAASPLLDALGVVRSAAGTIVRDDEWRTSVPGIYVAGDMQRGASLIVWAIDDGRRAAAAIDRDLMQHV